jgi:hypothetical protein
MTPAQLDALITYELGVQRVARGEAETVEVPPSSAPQQGTLLDALQLASMRLASG